jgi:hypothetical protein
MIGVDGQPLNSITDARLSFSVKTLIFPLLPAIRTAAKVDVNEYIGTRPNTVSCGEGEA